jgi:hypothetical protein
VFIKTQIPALGLGFFNTETGDNGGPQSTATEFLGGLCRQYCPPSPFELLFYSVALLFLVFLRVEAVKG